MTKQNSLTVLILAAGKGTRMKSGKAKVLHEVFYAPMVHHVLNAVSPLQPDRSAVIIGHQREAVTEAMQAYDVGFVTQEEQLGTGHAVLIAEQAVPEDTGTVMILCGDTPLIRPETLEEMYDAHCRDGADLTLMTTSLENPTNYGRILTGDNGSLLGIVEQKDATPEQQEIREINAGIYCVNRNFLFSALKQVGTDNSQGEVYLTDIVAIAVQGGLKACKFNTPHSLDVLGVNSRLELSQAHAELQKRRNEELMLSGISMISPETISVSPEAVVGRDCTLMNGVSISGPSSIGEGSSIGTGVVLKNCTVGQDVVIGPYCVLENETIPTGSVLKPLQTSL